MHEDLFSLVPQSLTVFCWAVKTRSKRSFMIINIFQADLGRQCSWSMGFWAHLFGDVCFLEGFLNALILHFCFLDLSDTCWSSLSFFGNSSEAETEVFYDHRTEVDWFRLLHKRKAAWPFLHTLQKCSLNPFSRAKSKGQLSFRERTIPTFFCLFTELYPS